MLQKFTAHKNLNILHIIKALLLLLSIFCFINGIICIIFLPFNIGNLMTLCFGLLVFLCVVFERRLILFLTTGWGRKIRPFVGIGAAAVLAGFFCFLAATMLQGTFVPAQNHQAIIVLGTGLNGRSITIPLAARLDKAIEYYHNNPDMMLVVSGGQGPGEAIPEAEAMAQYLVGHGVPADKILQENRSSNTTENFIFSKAVLDQYFKGKAYSVVFVTNRFHAYRSAYTAKKIGLDAQCFAAASKPFYMLPNFYFREYLAVIDYLFIKP